MTRQQARDLLSDLVNLMDGYASIEYDAHIAISDSYREEGIVDVEVSHDGNIDIFTLALAGEFEGHQMVRVIEADGFETVCSAVPKSIFAIMWA